jgi:hypothetical protein
MGMGTVSRIVRPGEVTLEGRPERVLIAGNRYPSVGELVPWIVLGVGLLVAPCYAAPRAPQPPPRPSQWYFESPSSVPWFTPPIIPATGQAQADSTGAIWGWNHSWTLASLYRADLPTAHLTSGWTEKVTMLPSEGRSIDPYLAGISTLITRDNRIFAWWGEHKLSDPTDTKLTFVEGSIGGNGMVTVSHTTRLDPPQYPIPLYGVSRSAVPYRGASVCLAPDGHLFVAYTGGYFWTPGDPNNQYCRCVVAGRSNSVGTFADGITWSLIRPWEEVFDYTAEAFETVALCATAAGNVACLYNDGAGTIRGRRLTGGAWEAEVLLRAASPNDSARLESLAHRGSSLEQAVVAYHLKQIAGGAGIIECANLDGDGAVLTLSNIRALGALPLAYGGKLGLTWNQAMGVLFLYGKTSTNPIDVREVTATGLQLPSIEIVDGRLGNWRTWPLAVFGYPDWVPGPDWWAIGGQGSGGRRLLFRWTLEE